ncbi:hypothetical protein TNCV_1552971 [Trichonephila clavipes]|nr:hypothetical protein TNCV_1552971 [Trichonephila clavipes]
MVSLGDRFFYFCSLADFVRDVEALMELHASWTSHGHLHTTTRLQQDYDAPDIFFFFFPIKSWAAVREPGVCESGVREVPVEWKTSLFEP